MAQPPTEPMPAPVRRLGGRYRLASPLGRGGMAVVWRATDELLGRDVAVKTLDLTGPDSVRAGERFQREARATAALNHPNIVTVYDTGVEGDTAYLVMELLPGPTLADHLQTEGRLPVEEVRTIGQQVCGALAAAHAAGIIHRDIKPGNIAHAGDGTVKVLDFGITQLVDEALGHHALTATNTVVGTAEYLAPEQASGGRVDERADLYALGCVLTALLTGSPPFSAPTAVAVLMAHAQQPAPDVRVARPDTPADMAALVASLLAKDPADRPRDAAEVAAHLRNRTSPGAAPTEVYAAPLPAQPASPPQPTGGPPDGESSSRWWVWLLVALAVVGVAAYLLFGRDPQNPSPASSPTTITSPSASTPSPPTPSTTVTETATATATATPTQSPSPPAGEAGAGVLAAADAFERAVQDVADSGALDEDVATAVQEDLRNLRRGVDSGDKAKVDDAMTAIDEALKTATADDSLTADGAKALAGPFANLQQSVDDWTP